MSNLILEGTLIPQDGVKGCTFKVIQVSEEWVHVILRSPYNDEVVEQDHIKLNDLGDWLLLRVNY